MSVNVDAFRVCWRAMDVSISRHHQARSSPSSRVACAQYLARFRLGIAACARLCRAGLRRVHSPPAFVPASTLRDPGRQPGSMEGGRRAGYRQRHRHRDPAWGQGLARSHGGQVRHGRRNRDGCRQRGHAGRQGEGRRRAVFAVSLQFERIPARDARPRRANRANCWTPRSSTARAPACSCGSLTGPTSSSRKDGPRRDRRT